MRKFFIFALLAVISVTAVDAKPKGHPRKKTGDYDLVIGGFAHGTGQATVSGERLKIQASVTTATGESGDLNAGGLSLKDNHFEGTGNVLGRQAKFEGRIDVPSSEYEQTLRGVRLICMVKTIDDRYIKIVGYIPTQAFAKDRIDDEEEEKGRGRDEKVKKPKKK